MTENKAKTRSIKVGDKMKDGTIYAGISPETGEAMYVPPTTISGTLQWNEAMKYAADLDIHGHKDWYIPTDDELGVLYQNRAEIGGFIEAGLGCYYWSSTDDPDESYGPESAFTRRFNEFTGYGWCKKTVPASVRPVRFGPAPLPCK